MKQKNIKRKKRSIQSIAKSRAILPPNRVESDKKTIYNRKEKHKKKRFKEFLEEKGIMTKEDLTKKVLEASANCAKELKDALKRAV